jgi:hypothetical protein
VSSGKDFGHREPVWEQVIMREGFIGGMDKLLSGKEASRDYGKNMVENYIQMGFP